MIAWSVIELVPYVVAWVWMESSDHNKDVKSEKTNFRNRMQIFEKKWEDGIPKMKVGRNDKVSRAHVEKYQGARNLLQI